jgi:hypothetical protein
LLFLVTFDVVTELGNAITSALWETASMASENSGHHFFTWFAHVRRSGFCGDITLIVSGLSGVRPSTKSRCSFAAHVRRIDMMAGWSEGRGLQVSAREEGLVLEKEGEKTPLPVRG